MKYSVTASLRDIATIFLLKTQSGAIIQPTKTKLTFPNSLMALYCRCVTRHGLYSPTNTTRFTQLSLLASLIGHMECRCLETQKNALPTHSQYTNIATISTMNLNGKLFLVSKMSYTCKHMSTHQLCLQLGVVFCFFIFQLSGPVPPKAISACLVQAFSCLVFAWVYTHGGPMNMFNW